MSSARFVLDGRAVAPTEAVLGADTGLVRSGEAWFETVRGEQGRWMFEADHLARMLGSIAASGLDADAALRSLKPTLEVASNDLPASARLRLLVTPSPLGAEGWQSLAEVSTYAPPEALYANGAVLRSAPMEHPGLGLLGKSASYHWSQFAQRAAEAQGADEALFWCGGAVAEGARSTLLWREAGQWWTPDVAGLLPSVTLTQLEADGLALERGRLDGARLAAYEGLVLVSSLRLAVPVCSVDGNALPVLRAEAAEMRSRLLELHGAGR